VHYARRFIERHPNSDFALMLMAAAQANSADWTDPDTDLRLHERIDRALGAGEMIPVPLFSYLHIEPDPARNRKAAVAAATKLDEMFSDVERPFDFAARRRGDRRLRIGYVSYDFRNHPTAHLIGNSFAAFDRGRFEIFAYGYGREPNDVYRRRIRESVDSFADITTESYEATARRIYDDGIDILIDQMGWTRNCRMPIFALRPAPIQAGWLGYPGTTGASFIDYIIADPVILPHGDERHYSEQVVRLPHFYMVNDRSFELDLPPTSRSANGLADDAFVFCSFNATNKLDPVMFAAWMRILRRVPRGILWVMGEPLVERNLKREAAAAGVDPARIVMAPRRDKLEHLARLALADLTLDTRFYNGHTTTCDSLWAGVPVLTLRGTHFPGRVSASALSVLGLTELITETLEAYETLAVRLATDPAALASLRDRLMATRTTSPLVDTARWVRNMERVYLGMWARFRDGLPPAGFDVVEP
jgi:predicted O-linked N-acetylglucosamine transferase (SPINDLY family)